MTLTIELPDNAQKDVVVAISNLIKNAGGSIVIEDDDNLTQAEFDLLQESYKEVLQMRKGTTKLIPFSELWND